MPIGGSFTNAIYVDYWEEVLGRNGMRPNGLMVCLEI